MGKRRKAKSVNKDPIVKRIKKHHKPKPVEPEPEPENEGFLRNLHNNTHVIAMTTETDAFEQFKQQFRGRKKK
jgi:hypothetical protein